MTLADLIAEALRTYPFRAARPGESPDAYRAALVDHVATRDFAAAHELRVGRRQADWTADDLAGFQRFFETAPRTRPEMAPGEVLTWVAAEVLDELEVTEASLLALAAAALDDFKALIAGAPDVPPIMLHVLMTDGRLHVGPVGRADRVALVRAIVQRAPVYGFFIIADAWMHSLTPGQAKQDALIMHVGTREFGRMESHPYRRRVGGVEWRKSIVIDKRGPDVQEDPYASVFVSVPLPTGGPS